MAHSYVVDVYKQNIIHLKIFRCIKGSIMLSHTL